MLVFIYFYSFFKIVWNLVIAISGYAPCAVVSKADLFVLFKWHLKTHLFHISLNDGCWSALDFWPRHSCGAIEIVPVIMIIQLMAALVYAVWFLTCSYRRVSWLKLYRVHCVLLNRIAGIQKLRSAFRAFANATRNFWILPNCADNVCRMLLPFTSSSMTQMELNNGLLKRLTFCVSYFSVPSGSCFSKYV